jgi:LysM repeat protein
VTRYDLILATNTLRVSNGLPALLEDPIVNAVAQQTAEIMAANEMSWHIGDVRGRLKAAGYGGGATVWATENFAVGRDHSIDEIMLIWSDPTHSIPVVNPAYCNVGAGVAKASNGSTYYVLQAAYTSEKACGEYKSVVSESGSGDTGQISVPQIIIPVKVAAPDADGNIYHEVQNGQSFWSIAIAYKITIKDIEYWNNISRENKLLVGQRLFIPSSNTEGYATPTPVGMVKISAPDQDGRVVHTVREYQTLYTISTAYKVDVQRILDLNGLQIDWPLQIGQKLLIDPGFVTPSPTPRPLTPIERLTPASDGKYYHTVKSGETLSWIAGLYEINMYNLMSWNGLTESSIIRPDQQLLLQVTPPATDTPTPDPATSTPTATLQPPTATATQRPTQSFAPTEIIFTQEPPDKRNPTIWYASLGLIAGGLFLAVLLMRKKN